MKIFIHDERLNRDEYFPTYQTEGAAAIDLRACIQEELVLNPSDVVGVSAGFAVNIGDPNLAGLILPRSGLGAHGLVLGNTMGLIDSDYRGELFMTLMNRSAYPIALQPMMRVAQMVFVPIRQVPHFSVITDHDVFVGKSLRGIGGFGSTGKS